MQDALLVQLSAIIAVLIWKVWDSIQGLIRNKEIDAGYCTLKSLERIHSVYAVLDKAQKALKAENISVISVHNSGELLKP
jgi:hypothetical protein